MGLPENRNVLTLTCNVLTDVLTYRDMITITTREFQLKSGEYVRQLFAKEIDGITLVKYGKAIGTLVTGDKISVNKSVSTMSDKVVEDPVDYEELEKMKKKEGHYMGEPTGERCDMGTLFWAWCKAPMSIATHPFVAGEFRKCVKVTSVDGDDNPALIGGKYYTAQWVCKDCIEKIVSTIPEDAYGVSLKEVDEYEDC